MRFVRALGVLLVLAFTSVAWAGDAIPIQFSGGLIWVKVDCAGQPLNFVLDSGAGSTAISVEAARKLGLHLGSSFPVQGATGRTSGYHVTGFAGKVGTIPLKPNIMALNLGFISAACGKKMDGIIGQDFFQRRIVQIDFRSHRVELLDHATTAATSIALPLRRSGDAVCVPVGVNGAKPQWTRLDTGCTTALEWAATDAGSRKVLSAASLSLTKGVSCCHITTDVQLGGETLHGINTGLHARQMFAGEAGLLGTGVLSRYRVTIDSGSMKLLLDHN